MDKDLLVKEIRNLLDDWYDSQESIIHEKGTGGEYEVLNREYIDRLQRFLEILSDKQ